MCQRCHKQEVAKVVAHQRIATPRMASDNDVQVQIRCAHPYQVSSSHTPLVQRSVSRSEGPSSPKTSSPPGLTQKPYSFLFRTSSRFSVKSQVSISGSTQSLVEAGRTELLSSLRREERPVVIKLHKTLESMLKTTLPEDLGEVLSNGTVLCQLANHVRPRAVSIIHIPSPAVPKLSTAKCRLNVENFIAACRKLGVPERRCLCALTCFSVSCLLCCAVWRPS
eukprot:XP_014010900.1 PREDICTED: leucine-rich repeat and calponin homology domain-containing protein 1-like [Salmo salar]